MSLPQQLRALAPPYLIVLGVSAAMALRYAFSIGAALLAPGIPADFADKDFANYWTAARLVLDGRTADLFGPQPVYFAHLITAFGPDYPWHNWSYPPHVLLLLWPLGFFGYKAALLLFLGATGLFFAWALRAFAGRGNIIVWVAALPFILHNIETGQNGFLTAGLGLGVLALRDRRPLLAGILLGLLTIKPQLGLLFPFLLIAERRWTVIASAAVTTLALVAATAALFGVDAWRGYAAEVLPYQALVMRDLEGTFLAMLPSVYGMMRVWGFGADAALAMHLALAIPVAIIAVAAFFRLGNGRDRDIVLLVATFLVTPYALSYDLGLFAAALALMAGMGRDDAAPRKDMLLAIAMLLPLLMVPLGGMKVPIAPAVMLAVFVLALRQADFFPRRRPVAASGSVAKTAD